jgi:hypothetical protein
MSERPIPIKRTPKNLSKFQHRGERTSHLNLNFEINFPYSPSREKKI